MNIVSNILFKAILDFAFPPSKEILELENMSVEMFLKKTHTPGPTPDTDLYACRMYKDPLVKTALFEFKFKRNLCITKLLAEVMSLHIKNNTQANIVLVPIPPHASRIAEYGFNQTELLAGAMEKIYPQQFSCANILRYDKKQSIQKKKNRTDRLATAEHIFKVIKPELVRGKNVVVVDDVITTGATCLDAIRALREVGAKKVVALAVAH